MAQIRYPIGIQTFSEIINGGYTYVDKTAFIPTLLNHGKYIFLSRPRRFGKSLLLSTLKSYFEGRRDLFKGLAIDGMDVDWILSPVLHFDFNNGYYEDIKGLVAKLHDSLIDYEEEYGLPIGEKNQESIPLRFRQLIKTIYNQTGRQVVILIDEYDKPLLAVEEDKDIFADYQRLLKSFYGNLKSMDSMIRYVFITGVARFSRVSIFSDLNNLDDISMEDAFANVCGWSEEELLNKFHSGIESLAEAREESFNTTLEALRNYYDGYLFTPKGKRLYNPFSVLRALKAKSIEPYWFITGTPIFLVKRIRNMEIFPPAINGVECSKEDLIAVGLSDQDPIPLMFQTGYLTIGREIERDIYELRFPNREVEKGFYRELLPEYAPATENRFSAFGFNKFRKDLMEGEPEAFMRRLSAMLKDLPGEDHCESVYRAITYLIAVLCSTVTMAEHHGYRGRSDIEVLTRNYIYLFEFKYNRSVSEAMAQIHSRDYAGRYAMDSRPVFLIGANFNENREDRGLEYEIEEMKK